MSEGHSAQSVGSQFTSPSTLMQVLKNAEAQMRCHMLGAEAEMPYRINALELQAAFLTLQAWVYLSHMYIFMLDNTTGVVVVVVGGGGGHTLCGL